MFKYILITIFSIAGQLNLAAQEVHFSPDIVVGNRSASYQHLVIVKRDAWSMDNVVLIDADHKNDDNNIYFIRNTISYNLLKKVSFNVGFGIKNPGTFSTLSGTVRYNSNNLWLSYSFGGTYQEGLTLEQNVILSYAPKINSNTRFYFNLFIVMNTDLKVLDRGIQKIRLGLKKKKLMYGFAFSFDQFRKAEKTLENYGLFIKYNF